MSAIQEIQPMSATTEATCESCVHARVCSDGKHAICDKGLFVTRPKRALYRTGSTGQQVMNRVFTQKRICCGYESMDDD